MRRQWYYRGSLKSCNYSCSYCPFSKRRGSEQEQQDDRAALFRFIDCLAGLEGEEGAVQIVPYGEALIHPYYWEGLAMLSQNARLDVVGAQSNFSFPSEQMLSIYHDYGGSLEKLRLWGTFHPEMTTVEQFVRQCRLLSTQKVTYCVGVVGVPEHLETIKRLRRELPISVYLWINKMDGLGRNYTASERQAFLEIDEYFEMELAHHRAEPTKCAHNRFVEADGTMRRCNLCRQSTGNLYGAAGQKTSSNEGKHSLGKDVGALCSRKECSCYLAYCNSLQEQLLFFQPYPAFRIPRYPKAVFFDVDGTLIPEGQTQLPPETTERLMRLADHCDIYLATSLPYEIAKRRTAPIWDMLRGGVFANGGRWIIRHSAGQEQDRQAVIDEIVPVDTDWLAQAERWARRDGFTLHVYKKGRDAYKVTLLFRRGRLPEDYSVQFLQNLALHLGIPDSCQLLREENCIEVTGKGTGKLEGVLSICREMGYERDEVAVFGNSENDISMLEYFPFSKCVKN